MNFHGLLEQLVELAQSTRALPFDLVVKSEMERLRSALDARLSQWDLDVGAG